MNNAHILWAVNVLNDHKYHIHASAPELIQHTPWSEIYRFKTAQGFVFLKRTPPALAIEPKVIDLLHKEFHAPVPKIIATNPDEHCFLMQDAGIQLHEYFKENFQADVLVQAMQHYSTLQIATSDKVDLFLNIGVPDWRLTKLPELYRDLASHHALLLDDGLSKNEIIKLQSLESKLLSICNQLSSYSIKETFGHTDFHDKNILINLNINQITLIDLGEVVITHPFFSFHNCLYRAKENFSLSNTQYQQLRFACLKPWLALDTQEHLLEILEIMQQCWSIHSVLGEFRLMNSVNKAAFQELRRQGRLANSLRHWINQ